jgi:hypothetical protein
MFMSTYLLSLAFLSLLLPVSTRGQAGSESPDISPVFTVYDKSKNKTTVSVTVTPSGEAAASSRISFEAGFSYQGKSLKSQPGSINFTVRSFTRQVRFAKLNSFIVLIDGKSVKLNTLVRSELGPAGETLVSAISYETFLKIAQAKKVVMYIRELEYELPGAELNKLSKLAEHFQT